MKAGRFNQQFTTRSRRSVGLTPFHSCDQLDATGLSFQSGGNSVVGYFEN
jgi:hypothetical protein